MMSHEIYKTTTVWTMDGVELEISPLKIKYLREFMTAFKAIGDSLTEDESIDALVECARICMKQFYPEISQSIETLSDNLDMPTVYIVLDFAGGIKINRNKQESVPEQVESTQDKMTWDDLDLAKLESEVFLVGVWKNFDEMEKAMSLPELMAVISTNRELDYEEKKFLAAMQGVDLDEQTGQADGQKAWEDMKARVYSRGSVSDSSDILALQGQNARNAGFGIGMGLSYEKVDDTTPKTPDSV
jgi:hypothetical protein